MELLPANWGGIRLWASKISTDGGRNVIVHDLTEGDIHPTHNSGLAVKRVRMSLMFDDFPGETDSPRTRVRRLQAAIDSHATAVLTHPLITSFVAEVGPFSTDVDEHSNITAEIEFVPVDDAPILSPAGAGVPGFAGEASVGVAADALDAELRALYDDETLELLLGLEDSPLKITEDARTAVAQWNAGEEVPTRQVLNDTADLLARIDNMIEVMALEEDLALFDIHREAIMLGDAVRAAALSATAETPAVFTMRVTEPVIILRLAARVYGGAQAEQRERQIRELNGIGTPAWFGPGDLVMPARDTSTRTVF